jgi:PAS domain S-box-containing protein
MVARVYDTASQDELMSHELTIDQDKLSRALAEIRQLRRENDALRAQVEADGRHTPQSAEQLRALLQAFPDLHFRLSAGGLVLSIEAGPRTELYKPADQMLGARISDIVPPPVSTMFHDALARVEATGESVGLDYPLRVGGRDRYFEARLIPLDENNEILLVVREVTERRLAERQLLFQNSLLEAESEASLDGILVVSETGRVLSFNRRYAQMWDIPESVLATRCDAALLDFVHEMLRDPDEFRRRIDYLYRNPLERSSEEIELVDGRLFERYSAPITGAGDMQYGRVWFFRDVTDRRRAEQALAVSEQRFRLMIEQSPLSVQIMDADGRILRVNRAWEKLWGVTLADLPDYNLLQDPEVERRGILPHIRRAFAGEHVNIPPIDYVPDRGSFQGRPRWVRATAYPVKDPHDRVREVVLIHEDITEQTRAEEHLRRLAAHARCIMWHATIEGFPGWRLPRRPGQRRFRWNLSIHDEHAAQQIVALDVQPGQTYASTWLNCRDHGDVEAARPNSDAAFLNGQNRYQNQFRCYDKHGHTVWLSEDVSVQSTGDGRWQAFGVCTDVTELKRSEEALRQSERHYRDAAESNKRLLMEVDHRVKNNLAGLLSLVSLVQGRAKSVHAFARAMESRLLGMAHIHHLLAGSGWREVSFRSLLASLLSDMDMLARHRPELIMEGPDVMVRPSRALPLTMVLVEWFTNSAKYGAHSRTGGKLSISWDLEPSATGANMRLRWRESGGPPIDRPITPSLGTELVTSFVANELQGSCELRYPPEGADHRIEMPVD